MHVADPDNLAYCVAITHAQEHANRVALMQLAEKLRFGAIVAASPDLGHDRFDHRLVFNLVHFDVDEEARGKLVHQLRHAPSVSLAYAPVVIFLLNPHPHDIAHNVELGFDEVIGLPESGRAIRTRLAGQIGQEHLYIETRHYLGPDRYRLDPPGIYRGKPEEEHTRLTILRTPEEGVQIKRRQVGGKKFWPLHL